MSTLQVVIPFFFKGQITEKKFKKFQRAQPHAVLTFKLKDHITKRLQKELGYKVEWTQTLVKAVAGKNFELHHWWKKYGVLTMTFKIPANKTLPEQGTVFPTPQYRTPLSKFGSLGPAIVFHGKDSVGRLQRIVDNTL